MSSVLIIPLAVIAAVVVAPATSTTPEKSPVAASISPEIVRFRIPVESMFASVVTTLDAIAVPAVRPSNSSSSASARTALPAVNPAPDITPVTSKLPPEDKVIFVVAVSLAPVWNISDVAFADELKSPSEIAAIAPATNIASVPAPSSGAWKLILPNKSLTAMSVSPV